MNKVHVYMFDQKHIGQMNKTELLYANEMSKYSGSRVYSYTTNTTALTVDFSTQGQERRTDILKYLLLYSQKVA